MVQRMCLNTLSDIWIMMLLDHYVYLLPQMTGYARKFDENATMSFRANNKQFLKNCHKKWKKIENY